MAELADALDSKSSARKGVWVRAPPSVLTMTVVRLVQMSNELPSFSLICTLLIAVIRG